MDRLGLGNIQKKSFTFKSRVFFITLFGILFIYQMFLKSELYESRTALVVRDLSSAAQTANLGLSILGTGSSSQLQDSMVVQEYINSLDMFLLLDEEFHLTAYYKSGDIDTIGRLSSSATVEETLLFYRKNLIINYDESSAILHIAYTHTDAQTAQKVLQFMVESVEYELNEFNRRKAKKQLKFIETEHAKNKQTMDNSLALLESYQNDNLLLDPTTQADSSSSIIANLEASLTQKNIELKTKSTYLNSSNHEISSLRSEIEEIKISLSKAKTSLTGSDKSGLNKMLFEYDKLKMQVEFDTEVYKNALLQLETLKLDALKEAKTLSIVSKPNLPDGYTYPDKPKTLITLIIVFLLIYGIFSMLYAIIKDHKE